MEKRKLRRPIGWRTPKKRVQVVVTREETQASEKPIATSKEECVNTIEPNEIEEQWDKEK